MERTAGQEEAMTSIQDPVERIKDLEAEVERYKRSWLDAEASETTLIEKLHEAKAEVERLRLDIESFKRIQASAEAEVERLRGDSSA
jgi:chromosome segregation ATPase